jgi:hypothetical protein
MIKVKKVLAISLVVLSLLGAGVGSYPSLPAEGPAAVQEAATRPAEVEGTYRRIPAGHLPSQALVSLDSKGRLVVKAALPSYDEVRVTKPGLPTGMELRRVTRIETRTLDRKSVRVYDTRGRKIDERKWPGLLTKEILALVIRQPEEPDPADLQLFKEGTLIFQLPALPSNGYSAPPPVSAAPAPTPAPPTATQDSLPPPPPPPPPPMEAPVSETAIIRLPGTDYNATFDKALEVVRRYFDVSYTNRYEGRIETAPLVGWAGGVRSVGAAGELPKSGETVRHRAIIQITPLDAGGFSVSVRVLKDVNTRPGAANATWTPAGCDTVLEQAILRQFTAPDSKRPTNTRGDLSPQTHKSYGWSDYGVLRKTSAQVNNDRASQPVFSLEDNYGRVMLHATAKPGSSLARYVGRTVTLYGRIISGNDSDTPRHMIVTHVALFGLELSREQQALQRLYSLLANQGWIAHPKLAYEIGVKEVKGRKLLDVQVMHRNSEGRFDMSARAREAELSADPATGKISLTMHQCRVSAHGDRAFFEKRTWVIDVPPELFVPVSNSDPSLPPAVDRIAPAQPVPAVSMPPPQSKAASRPPPYHLPPFVW